MGKGREEEGRRLIGGMEGKREYGKHLHEVIMRAPQPQR